MKRVYEFSPYMLVVYGEKKPFGYFMYKDTVLPFDNATVENGVLSFTITAESMESIGAGMCYSMPNFAETDESYMTGFVETFYSPVLVAKKGNPIVFTVRFDPTNIEEMSLKFENQEFESVYTNVYGIPLRVTPTSDSALVLERVAKYRHKNGAESEFYLGLLGTFSAKGSSVLCGGTGTEYIAPQNGESVDITFSSGNRAYANGIDKFANFTTCAYLSFGGSDYCCQSSESPFYTPDNEKVFEFLPLKLMNLPAVAAPMFPMMDEKLEQCISAARFKAFTATIESPTDALPVYAITKNGLLATVQSGMIDKVVFAIDPNGSQAIELDVDESLLLRLQCTQSRIFFKAFPEGLSHAEFKPDDWQFDFSKEKWREDTRIILKYSDGESIEDWLSQEFPDDNVLRESVRCATNEDGTIPEHYAEFMQVIRDPKFTGMVLLNCVADYDKNGAASEFIAGVNGVMTAHHLIVRAGNFVHTNSGNPGGIGFEPSLINAVVDYKNSEAKITYDFNNPPPLYDFATVAVLSVVQRNLTTSLKTTSELLVNNLFDCAARSVSNEGGNALIIDGELRQRSGMATFEYALRRKGEYVLGESLLERIIIDNVLLAGGVFSLSGGIGFCIVADGVDLFGYGGDNLLQFDNLRIHRLNTYAAYASDYTQLALRKSDARADSFPAVFPSAATKISREVKPLGGVVPLITAKKNTSVADFTGAWWSLGYPLVVGNLGELSGGKDFAFTIMLCWCGESFYAGIVPPGGLLGEGLSVSGILGLSAKAIKLAPVPVDESGNVTAYELAFTGIGINVLKFSLAPKGANDFVVRGGVDGVSWKFEYDKGGK